MVRGFVRDGGLAGKRRTPRRLGLREGRTEAESSAEPFARRSPPAHPCSARKRRRRSAAPSAQTVAAERQPSRLAHRQRRRRHLITPHGAAGPQLVFNSRGGFSNMIWEGGGGAQANAERRSAIFSPSIGTRKQEYRGYWILRQEDSFLPQPGN
jgi:hypothetical protein